MKTLITILSVVSLTLSACTGAIGHGALPAPGPEAFAPSAVVTASAQGVLPAPGPESFTRSTVTAAR